MIVAWTGHRPELFDDPAAAEAAVAAVAGDLVARERVTRFVVGGQRGVDTWAAFAAIVLGVSFTLILPLAPAEFTRDWADDDRQALEHVGGRAGAIHIVDGDPARAFTERNRLLVADADLLVAVWTGVTGGGTVETIAFARANGTPLREVLLTPSAGARVAHGRGI